ncbi:MAG TPA: hypothetical protein PLX46_04010 [Thiobacillaceae bacterium]|nr:hypothetical protein [Thiobacillaceae bacterium]
MSIPDRFQPARLLLYLSSAGASCALLRQGRVEQALALPIGEEGWESFNGLLIEHPGLPVAIAVDTVDEVYRQDLLPRARGRDRREMTERRLRQLIHHSPYQAALRQGPLNDDSQRDRYLMMGLSSPDIIRPWLDIIHIRGTYVSGIWLLPTLAISLASRFGLHKSRLLLVSEQTGGLRLTYLEQGELRFSRLAPVDSSQHENPLEGYAEEIERTRQALVGQRLLSRSDILRTVLLDPLNSLAGLHTFLPLTSGFECELIQRARLLEALALPPDLLTESSDALYLRLLPLAPADGNLINREQRLIARTQGLKRVLRGGARLVLGISALACATLLIDSWRLNLRATEARTSTEQLRRQEESLLARAGGAQALAHRLAAVEAWHQVASDNDGFQPGFKAMLDSLTRFPSIKPQRIEWSNALADGQPGLLLEADIVPFEGDYGRAQKLVEDLVADLRRHLKAGSRAQVAAWPLDTSSQLGLEGEFGHSRLSASFRIEVRPGP